MLPLEYRNTFFFLCPDFSLPTMWLLDTWYGLKTTAPKKGSLFEHEKTPPKMNIEPENDDLEDDFPLPGIPGGPYSQVNHVNLPGWNNCNIPNLFPSKGFFRGNAGSFALDNAKKWVPSPVIFGRFLSSTHYVEPSPSAIHYLFLVFQCIAFVCFQSCIMYLVWNMCVDLFMYSVFMRLC